MYHRLEYFFTLIIILVITSTSLSQDSPYVHYTQENGFPASTVYSDIVQDENGIMWFPTDQGLVKYDGRSFEIVPVEGVSDHEFTQCDVDQNGKIWLVNNSQEILYLDVKANRIQQLKNKSDQSPIKLAKGYSITLYKNWIWFFNGSKDHRRTLWKIDINNHDLHIYDKKGGMLIQSKDKFYYRGNNQNFKFTNTYQIIQDDFIYRHRHFNIYKIPELYISYNINSLPDKFGVFGPRISTTNDNLHTLTVYKLSSPNHIVQSDSLPYLYGSCVLKKNNILWASPNGLYTMDSSTFKLSSPNPILSACHALSVTEDNEGGLWVGTKNRGVYYIPTLDSKISSIKKLGTTPISSLSSDLGDSNIWVGTIDGKILKYEPKAASIDSISLNKKDQIYSISETPTELLIANNSRELIYNKNSQSFVTLPLPIQPEEDFIDLAKDIEAIGNNTYILVTSNEIRYLDLNNNKVQVELRSRGTGPFCLLKDTSRNKIWCIGYSTSNYFDLISRELINIDLGHNSKINDLCTTPDGTLWLASPRRIMSFKDDSLLTLSQINHSSEINNKIISDDLNLFVGTTKGVKIINTKNNSLMHTINRADGLFDENVTALLIKGNILYIGTNSGLYQMNISNLENNTIPPKINISTFRIWDTNLDPNKKHRLKHTENDVFIEFSPISFRAQGLEQSKYRLLGYDTTWTYVGSEVHELRFPNLSSGDYTFQIKAINEDLVESIHPAEIKFNILKPIWQRWYFILGCIALSSAIIGLLLTRRQKREHQRQTEKLKMIQQLDRLKEAALRSQMNPHFLFNSLNSIMQFLIDNDKRASMDYLTRFSLLIRYVFEYSQVEEITLEEEINFLRTYLSLEELRFGSKIDVHLEIDPALPLSFIKLPPLLLQPIVENSFKHGFLHKDDKGILQINFLEINQNKMHIKIIDDGIGRHNSSIINLKKHYDKPRKSTSSAVVQDRINIFNEQHKDSGKNISMSVKDVDADNKEFPGTEVLLNITY